MRESAIPRKRGGLVPTGEAVSGLDDKLVPAAIRSASRQTWHSVHRGRSGAVGLGQRSGTGAGLHGADDGAVQLAPHQPSNRLQYKRVNPVDFEVNGSDAPPTEWRVLRDFAQRYRVSAPKDRASAMRVVAIMGGYMNRKHDGTPGATVLWRGY